MTKGDKDDDLAITISIDDENIEKVGKLLTYETSRNILKLLFSEILSAHEISQKIGISLQNVIYHIQRMQDIGIVKIARIKKNTKSQDMKCYTASKFAIVIVPASAYDKTRNSKLLKRSFNLIYKVASVGIAAVSTWFGTQFLQNISLLRSIEHDDSITEGEGSDKNGQFGLEAPLKPPEHQDENVEFIQQIMDMLNVSQETFLPLLATVAVVIIGATIILIQKRQY